jgi:hypothetical protein
MKSGMTTKQQNQTRPALLICLMLAAFTSVVSASDKPAGSLPALQTKQIKVQENRAAHRERAVTADDYQPLVNESPGVSVHKPQAPQLAVSIPDDKVYSADPEILRILGGACGYGLTRNVKKLYREQESIMGITIQGNKAHSVGGRCDHLQPEPRGLNFFLRISCVVFYLNIAFPQASVLSPNTIYRSLF